MHQRATKAAVWITILAVVIVAASFMPWAEIPVSEMRVSGMPGVPGMPEKMLDGAFGGMSVTVTGWNGNITVAGMKVPNWTTALLAAMVAAIAWLAAAGTGPQKMLALALAILGLLQAVVTIIVLIGSGKATLGIGLMVVAASFVGMVIASLGLGKKHGAGEFAG